MSLIRDIKRFKIYINELFKRKKKLLLVGYTSIPVNYTKEETVF